MATAELAVAIPVLLLVLAVSLAAVRFGTDRVRAVDAAHTGARLLARGEPEETALAASRTAAPTGSDVSVSRADGTVTVRVSCPPPRVLLALGIREPRRASATARLESLAPDADP